MCCHFVMCRSNAARCSFALASWSVVDDSWINSCSNRLYCCEYPGKEIMNMGRHTAAPLAPDQVGWICSVKWCIRWLIRYTPSRGPPQPAPAEPGPLSILQAVSHDCDRQHLTLLTWFQIFVQVGIMRILVPCHYGIHLPLYVIRWEIRTELHM